MITTRATQRTEEDIIRLCHTGLDSQALRVAVFERLQRVMPYEAFWCATTDPATPFFTGAVHDGIDMQVVPALVSNEFLRDDFNKFTNLAKNRQSVNTLNVATQGRSHP